MKKTIILSIIIGLLLTGCSFSVSLDNGEQNTDEQETPLIDETPEMADLSLQVLKTDAEKGISLDNHPIYQELTHLVQDNPKLGTLNDFTIHPVDILNAGQENAAYLFLAVNRTNQPLKNMSFLFSMGNAEGEMVWENAPIELKEEVTGVLQPNTAIPVYLSVNLDQESLIHSLTLDNLVMEINDFDYDKAD